MKIIPIFGKNLFAIQYTGEDKDEFRRLFKLWSDNEKVEAFFERNISDLTNGYHGTITIEDAIFKTIQDAADFETEFINLSQKGADEQLEGLNELFEPLNNYENHEVTFEKKKSKKTWLRIYGLKVEDDAYIITGGAIKLTRTMQKRRHTNMELSKLESVRNYLKDRGIDNIDNIVTEIEI